MAEPTPERLISLILDELCGDLHQSLPRRNFPVSDLAGLVNDRLGTDKFSDVNRLGGFIRNRARPENGGVDGITLTDGDLVFLSDPSRCDGNLGAAVEDAEIPIVQLPRSIKPAMRTALKGGPMMPVDLTLAILASERISPALAADIITKIASSIDGKEFTFVMIGEHANKITLVPPTATA